MTNQDYKVSYILTDTNLTINYKGETHIVRRSDALADQLIACLKENRLHEIPTLVSAAKRIAKFSKGNFQVVNGRVQVNGIDAPQVLSDRIVKFANEGLPYQPLVKFAENLQANPSFRAVNELYGFLEANDHPITENGCFIGYKRVREDFKDIYTGTFDNSPGQIVSMPRNQVNEDCTQTCSNGLHASNFSYAHTIYGNQSNDTTDVIIEVEINPKDVVAVPIDYANSKMRVSEYKVLGVVQTPYEPGENLRTTSTNPPTTSSSNNLDCEECGENKQYCICEFCEMCDEVRQSESDYCVKCGHYYEDGWCDECEHTTSDCRCEDDKAIDKGCMHCGEPNCYGECQDNDNVATDDEDRSGRYR